MKSGGEQSTVPSHHTIQTKAVLYKEARDPADNRMSPGPFTHADCMQPRHGPSLLSS